MTLDEAIVLSAHFFLPFLFHRCIPLSFLHPIYRLLLMLLIAFIQISVAEDLLVVCLWSKLSNLSIPCDTSRCPKGH